MKFLKRHWKKLLLLVIVSGLLVAVAPFYLLDKYEKKIYVDVESVKPVDIAIVFGAGVRADGQPSDVLKDRLKTAVELYDAGLVKKILVSGDNRFENYNEPEAMRDYLIYDLNVITSDIVLDYAGRRTYDTCIRAKEIFQVDNAILITQGYHLPRALFTCNSLGIESKGLSATRQEYVWSKHYKLREIVAIYKAMFDIYIWHPGYIGGEVESIDLY